MYYCELCEYKTDYASNFCIHKKSKKHLKLTIKKNTNAIFLANISSELAVNSLILADQANKNYNQESILECPYCKIIIKHKSSYSRHKKACSDKNINNNENKLLNKIEILEKEKELERREKELYQKLEKDKSELLNNFMENANNKINNILDNNKKMLETILYIDNDNNINTENNITNYYY